MALLDDNDPVAILSNDILAVLDKQDGATALAALAMTLASTLAYAARKQQAPMSPAVRELREQLLDLSVEMLRHRGSMRES